MNVIMSEAVYICLTSNRDKKLIFLSYSRNQFSQKHFPILIKYFFLIYVMIHGKRTNPFAPLYFWANWLNWVSDSPLLYIFAFFELSKF